MSLSENNAEVSDDREPAAVTKNSKKKSVPLSRTNKSSLEPIHQQKIVDFILNYEGTIKFGTYLTQCGCFGEVGSELRRRAVSRKKYLEKLRKNKTDFEFQAIVSTLKAPATADPEPCFTPSVPLRERTEAPTLAVELLPPKAASNSEAVLPSPAPKIHTENIIMDHLAPQVKKDVVIDFVSPERNEGLWCFKSPRLVYCNERITLCNFILPVFDPRDLMTLTVTLLPNFDGFKVRQMTVPDSIIGQEERWRFIKTKTKKQTDKVIDLDGCSFEEAEQIISSTASDFAVFCADMEHNTSSRFSERTYKFPDGLKARINFFGNTSSTVKIYYHANKFEFGSGQQISFGAAAEWYIALDMKIERLMNPRKNDVLAELDDCVSG